MQTPIWLDADRRNQWFGLVGAHAVSESLTAGRHLFRRPGAVLNLFVADRIRLALLDAGITGAVFERVAEA